MASYAKTILDNGIKVITESVPTVRSIAMGVLVDAGPRNELQNQQGLAHLTEHAFFTGTSSRNAGQIARLMDEAGGSMGAFTTRDYTCFTATVLDDYRTYALDLLGDILLNSIFPAENLDREKAAILREIDGCQDVPDERVHDLLKRSVWPDHPLGRPIAGYPDTVTNLTREDVIYFVHKHFLPDRVIVTAAGHLDHDDFVAQVRDAFWRMIGHSNANGPLPPTFHGGIHVEHMPVSQVYFCMGVQALPFNDANRYALHAINNVLGGGISSRLSRRIREERGLVYNIGSEYHAYFDDGLWIVQGSTSLQLVKQVLGLTLVELWKLITGVEPIDEEELWKAKMNLKSRHLVAGENTHTRMSRLATQEFYFGRALNDEEIIHRIDALTIGHLQDFACRKLKEPLRQILIAVVGPEDKKHYCKESIADIVSSFN